MGVKQGSIGKYNVIRLYFIIFSYISQRAGCGRQKTALPRGGGRSGLEERGRKRIYFFFLQLFLAQAFLAGLMIVLNVEDGLKASVEEAGMGISSPVCGLRPVRAARVFISKVPKPTS